MVSGNPAFLIDLHLLITVAAHPIGHSVSIGSRGHGARLEARPLAGPFVAARDSAAAGIWRLGGPHDLAVDLRGRWCSPCNNFNVFIVDISVSSCMLCMLSAPSLVEEEIGGLGADRLLVSQGHRRIVEVPVTVHLVLPVGGVCKK